MTPTLSSQAALTFPEALRPLFGRLVHEAVRNGTLPAVPVASAGEQQEYLMLLDTNSQVWLSDLGTKIRALLKPSNTPIPANIAVHIDASLLAAIIEARSQPRPDRTPKAAAQERQPGKPAAVTSRKDGARQAVNEGQPTSEPQVEANEVQPSSEPQVEVNDGSAA